MALDINGRGMLPDTGCVYLLVSLQNVDETYVGETKSLSKRLAAHNCGHSPTDAKLRREWDYLGSTWNDPAALRPWAVAAYICGHGHTEMDEGRRKELLDQWKGYNKASRIQCRESLTEMMENGKRIADKHNYNRDDDNSCICFVRTFEHGGFNGDGAQDEAQGMVVEGPPSAALLAFYESEVDRYRRRAPSLPGVYRAPAPGSLLEFYVSELERYRN